MEAIKFLEEEPKEKDAITFLGEKPEADSAIDFLEEEPMPSMKEPYKESLGEKFIRTQPTLYGIYGGAKAVGEELSKISYGKYIHPEEREKYSKLTTQEKTRDLLMSDLELVAMLGAGRIVKGVAPILQRYLPKTHKFLTKRILGKKPIEPVKVPPFKEKVIPEKPSVVYEFELRPTTGIKPRPPGMEVPTVKEVPTLQTSLKKFSSEQIENATKVEAMYDEAAKATAKLRQTSAEGIYKGLKRAFVDISGNIKKELYKHGDEGRRAIMRHDLIAGANSKAMRMVDDASKTIYEGLSQHETEHLNRLIQSRRTIAIEKYKQIKHPKGLGQKEHQDWLDVLDPKLRTKIETSADKYFNVMKDQLGQLRKEGLITKESYESLLSKGDYSPRNFLQHIDPGSFQAKGVGKITVADSGIKALAEGSEGLLERDSINLLSQVVSRTQARIFKNRANKALYELASNQPENEIVSLAKVAKKTKEGKLIYQKVPTGYEKVSVVIDGIHKEMIMPTELAKEWVMRDPAINAQMANMISWLTGSKLLRAMATGYNPEFALTNFPRDIAHIWLTTQEYSPTLPKALPQMARDLFAVMPDVIRRKGAWLDYINEGGGMEFLTHQGKVGKVTGALGPLKRALSWFGETSEIATRLMLRNRSLRLGKTPEEATWIARNYLDFYQGGNWAKAVDAGIPYLNASIQGTRGIFRAAAQKPSVFTYKVAQVGTLASSLYLANRDWEGWDQVSDREKVNNWIIPTPFTYQDKDKNTKYIYFKIAKDQGQRVMATIFENLMAKYMGDEVDATQVAQAVEDAIPILPTELLPPSVNAIMGYAANKDFWRMEDIWRGPRVKAYAEHTRYTHPAFIEIGKYTKLSPERTKYALSRLFTYGNIYTSMAGYGWNKLFDQMTEGDKQKVTQEIVLNQPFIRRVFNETNPYYKFEKNIEEVRLGSQTERHLRTRELDKISQEFYDGEKTSQEVRNFIYNSPIEDRKRLRERHFRRRRLQEVPNRRWWLNLMGMNPEARATVYWNRWDQADKNEQKELDIQRRKIPGISSKRFIREFSKLKRQE